jgi:LppP/LprE lipoprotein
MNLLALLLLLQSATWLDLPPSNWNTPAASIPAAEAVPATLPMCSADERPPASPEESQLAAKGWKLETYWSPIGGPAAQVLLATAGYDGMCRPWQFNAFVFSNGQFAGTLSPDPMLSRFDGVLVDSPVVLADGSLQAEFLRYAPTDAACCPSRGRTQVVYAVQSSSGASLVVPLEIGAEASLPAPAQVP